SADIVTATRHPDITRALRSAAPIFSGIVTRFSLRPMPLSPAIAVTAWIYRNARLAEVSASLERQSDLPSGCAESPLSLAAARPHMGLGDARFATAILSVYGSSMAEISGIAHNVADLLPPGAVAGTPTTPLDFATLYAIVDQSFPDGARYGVDCLWSQ